MYESQVNNKYKDRIAIFNIYSKLVWNFLRCCFKLIFCVNCCWHSIHWNCFSPVCTTIWRLTWALLGNNLKQTRHCWNFANAAPVIKKHSQLKVLNCVVAYILYDRILHEMVCDLTQVVMCYIWDLTRVVMLSYTSCYVIYIYIWDLTRVVMWYIWDLTQVVMWYIYTKYYYEPVTISFIRQWQCVYSEDITFSFYISIYIYRGISSKRQQNIAQQCVHESKMKQNNLTTL